MRIPLMLLLLSSGTLAFVHLMALTFSLYWQFEWFDVPVHMLGGLTIALGVYTAYELCSKKGELAPRLSILLFYVLGIGVLWELFELYAGVPIQDNFVFDTTIDLVMDVLGGYIGFFIYQKFSSGELSSN